MASAERPQTASSLGVITGSGQSDNGPLDRHDPALLSHKRQLTSIVAEAPIASPAWWAGMKEGE
jgi:hypothetical protein